MSSSLPPAGGPPGPSCPRCRMPVAPNAISCGNCGYTPSWTPPASQTQPPIMPPTRGGLTQPGPNPSAPTPFSPANPPSSQSLRMPGTPSSSGLLSRSSSPHLSSPTNTFAPSSQPMGSGTYNNIPMQPSSSGLHPNLPPSFSGPSSLYGAPNDFSPSSSAFGTQNSFQPGFSTARPSFENYQPVERSSPNIPKIIGIVAIVLVLLIVSVSTVIFLLGQSHPSSNTDTPYPTPKVTPVFADAFQDNAQQWTLPNETGKYTATIAKGTLSIEDDNKKVLPVFLPANKPFDNFKLFVDATLSKGEQANGYGLYIRSNADPNGNLSTYYRIEIYGDGSYAIFKGTTDANGASHDTVLVNGAQTDAIHPAGETNHLVVIAQGTSMTLIVNGQTVQTFSDASYKNGMIALFVSNVPQAHSGAQATFSHLAIYPANA